MKVRVLVITYNHERFIAQALDSVLMQETSFDWDVVVLDDCSTDGTRAILVDVQRRYPDKVHLVLAPENKCSNAALVAAFEESPSEYIAWLDGDDYWTSPHKLQRQVEFLDAHPDCSLCFHNVRVDYEDSTIPTHNSNDDDQKAFLTFDDIVSHNYISGCSPMFRRRLLPKLPRWYHTAMWGDWPLYILFAQKGPIGYINEVMGVYRVHRAGYWSGLSNTRKFEAMIVFYKAMNGRLNYNYNDLLQAGIAKWRITLALERSSVPGDAPIIVASEDGDTIKFWGRTAVKFVPGGAGQQGAPATGIEAITMLEEIQAEGHNFLLVPRSNFWWLDRDKELRSYLEASHRRIYQDEYCIIYQLA